MKKAKTIKIFPAPHVEIRLHVSEEMEEDFKKCYFSEGMYSCRKCSWSKNEYNRSNSNYSSINLYRICILHT